MDSANQIIENGDSIGYSGLWHASSGDGGARGQWCMITLPVPNSDSTYKMIYWRYDSLPSYASICYSTIRHSTSRIKAVEKDVKFSALTPEYGGIAACKHANGLDWWVVFLKAGTNCYQKYILSSDSFYFHSEQCIGREIYEGDVCKNVFSPDGSKMIRAAFYDACDIFDFDRCSGMLSNFIPLDTFNVVDTATGEFWDGITSAEFSSNNRFVYLNSASFVLQYDLWATDVNLSKDTVGFTGDFIDTIENPNSLFYTFYLSQTAPDGKIYVGPGFRQRFFSTIDNPNGKGDSCMFNLRSKILPKWNEGTITYSPNYRLGRMIGSACDTIYSDIKPLYTETPWLKVFPNPATDAVRLDYNWIEWDKISDGELQISDLEGRVVFKQKLPKYSYRQDMDISQLAQGIYTAHITATMRTGEQKKLATAKLVKQE